MFSYEEPSPLFQYLNISDSLDEENDIAEVRFVVGSARGIMFTGGVDINTSTGEAVVKETPTALVHLTTYPVDSIWSQFRYDDNYNLYVDYMTKRGFFSKKENEE